MLNYCRTERSYSEIMWELHLNPASLKHHQDLLLKTDLLAKVGIDKDTKYRTTALGDMMLNFVVDVLKAVRTA